MYEGTTPTYYLTVIGEDITNMTVYVTMFGRPSAVKITWTNGDEGLEIESCEDGTLITLTLTQEQTLQLGVGDADVQVKWIDIDGVACATEVGRVHVHRSLLREVITHREGE